MYFSNSNCSRAPLLISGVLMLLGRCSDDDRRPTAFATLYNWSALEARLNGSVSCMTVYDDLLVAGGGLLTSGFVGVSNIAARGPE